MKKLFAYGTKHIAPRLDYIVDVQCLANPSIHFKETGLHQGVQAEVITRSNANFYYQVQGDILKALYTYDRVGVRCSGGRHRSVAMVWTAAQNFNGQVELVFMHPAVRHMWDLIDQYGYPQAEIEYKKSQFYK